MKLVKNTLQPFTGLRFHSRKYKKRQQSALFRKSSLKTVFSLKFYAMDLKELSWYQTYMKYSQPTNKIKCEMLICYSVFSWPGLDINSTEGSHSFSLRINPSLNFHSQPSCHVGFEVIKEGVTHLWVYYITFHLIPAVFTHNTNLATQEETFLTCCMSLQDNKRVKLSPDFSVRNICYKTKKIKSAVS